MGANTRRAEDGEALYDEHDAAEDGEALYDEHDAAAALGVEADELEPLLAAGADMSAASGAGGLRRLMRAQAHVEPGQFVERLFPFVISLITDLMNRTPLEGLDTVELTDTDRLPQQAGPGVWDEGCA